MGTSATYIPLKVSKDKLRHNSTQIHSEEPETSLGFLTEHTKGILTEVWACLPKLRHEFPYKCIDRVPLPYSSLNCVHMSLRRVTYNRWFRDARYSDEGLMTAPLHEGYEQSTSPDGVLLL